MNLRASYNCTRNTVVTSAHSTGYGFLFLFFCKNSGLKFGQRDPNNTGIFVVFLRIRILLLKGLTGKQFFLWLLITAVNNI